MRNKSYMYIMYIMLAYAIFLFCFFIYMPGIIKNLLNRDDPILSNQYVQKSSYDEDDEDDEEIDGMDV